MRKKQLRKEEFTTLPNCLDQHPHKKGSWQSLFPLEQPLCIEMGCGKGDFSLQQASFNPNRNYIAIDVKRDRLWYGAKKALEQNLQNIIFLHEDIYILNEVFAPQELSLIWVTFPDPYPKNAHARRRLTSPFFLKCYREVLKSGGEVHFKTDNVPLFDYSIEMLKGFDVQIHALTRDLHYTEGFSPEIYFETAYEKKFRAEGLPIHYVCFSFN